MVLTFWSLQSTKIPGRTNIAVQRFFFFTKLSCAAPMLGALKHEMYFHLQRESISGIQPPEQSKRCRTILNKGIKRNLFKPHRLRLSTHLRASLWVNFAKPEEIKSSIPSTWQRNQLRGFISMLPATAASTWGQHPPTGPPQKLHLRASEERSVWRSMQSFTSAARTCLGAAVHAYTQPRPPYRGSALCQPCSGTYYRSCWNDGF